MLEGEDRQRDVRVLSREQFFRTMMGKGLVALGGFSLGYLIDAVWARLVRGYHLERVQYPKLVLGRYRIHHNVVGYLAILLGLFRYPLLLIPLGLGVIIGHKRRDRLFWFIERVR